MVLGRYLIVECCGPLGQRKERERLWTYSHLGVDRVWVLQSTRNALGFFQKSSSIYSSFGYKQGCGCSERLRGAKRTTATEGRADLGSRPSQKHASN